MPVMGLKINSPSNGFAVKSSLGADFAKALFGDPEMEIKFRRLQSDLVNDEYYRRAQAAATALNEAKTADQLWRTGAGQGAVDPASQYAQDAMAAGDGGGGGGAMPVPIDLGDPNAVPIPAQRPISTIIGPDTYGSTELPPVIAGQARSQAQESPGNPPLEPNLRLTSFPRVSDFTLPGSAPVPTRRPGEFPDMPAPIGEADYGPSLTDAIPFSVDELLGTPPPVEPEQPIVPFSPLQGRPSFAPEPEVPFNPLQGQPNFFPDYHDSRMPGGPLPPDPYAGTDASAATPNQFVTLSDIVDYFRGGADVPEALTPAPVWDAGYPIEENTFETRPAPPPGLLTRSEQARENTLDYTPPPPPSPETPGAFARENTFDMPVPVQPQAFDAGQPIEENTLDYVPEPSHPFPVPIMPYEAPPRPEGAVTEIPGRGRVSPDGPFPPNLGGLDTGVPASVPPNVPPERIPGRPYQGPPIPMPETPDVATGETDVRGPSPAEEVGVIHNKAGQPIARLDADSTRALMAGIIANGGDVAGGINKLVGGLGVTYGDINDADRLRINSMLATGNLPTTTTMITSKDRAATDHAIEVERAKIAADPKRGIISDQFGDREVETDANGNRIIKPIVGGAQPAPSIQNVPKDTTPYAVTRGKDGNAVLKVPEGFDAATQGNDALAGSDNEQETIMRDTAILANDPGGAISAKQAYDYDLIYNKLSQPHLEYRQVEQPDGTKAFGAVQVPPRDLSAYPLPAEIFARAGVKPRANAPAAPAEVAAPAAAAGATTPDRTAAAAAAAGDPAVRAPVVASFNPLDPQPATGPAVGTQPDGNTYGTSGFKIIVPGGPKDRSEFQSRAWLWLNEAAFADGLLKTMDPPNFVETWAMQLGGGPGGLSFTDAILQEMVPDEEAKQFAGLAATFINSDGRINSGATIQTREDVSFGLRFIDRKRDSVDTRNLKAQQRKVAMDGIYDVLSNAGLLTQQMVKELESRGYRRDAPATSGGQQNIIDYNPQIHGGGSG